MDQWLETRTYLNAELGASQPQSDSVYPLIQKISRDEAQLVVATLPTQEQTSIVAGNNVTLTGDGTSADPYVISAERSTLAPGVNTTVTGDGVVLPYRVNVDLPPPTPATVVSSGNPVTTEVQQTADGYSVEARAVGLQAGDNITITGTGYGATPYIITAAPIISEVSIVDGDNTVVEGTGIAADPYKINVQFPDAVTVISGNDDTTTVVQTVNEYAVAALPFQLEAGSRISLAGGDGYSQAVTVSADAVELVNGNNTIVSGDGTSVTPYRVDVNFPDPTTVSAGDNVTVTQAGNDYQVSAVPYQLAPADGSITIDGNGYTSVAEISVNFPDPTTVSAGDNVTVTQTGSDYAVAALPYQLVPADGSITIDGNGYTSVAEISVNFPPPTPATEIITANQDTTEVVATPAGYSVTAVPYQLVPADGSITINGNGYTSVAEISVNFPPPTEITTANQDTTEIVATPTGYSVTAKPVSIVAGDRIEVTGDGYSQDYVIAADRVTVTAGAGITVTGDGYTDPYNISVDGAGGAPTITSGGGLLVNFDAPSNEYVLTNTRPMAPGRTLFLAKSWPANADPTLYFTSLADAYAALPVDIPYSEPWTIVVYPGEYAEPNFTLAPNAYVAGVDPDACVIRAGTISYTPTSNAISARVVLRNLNVMCDTLNYTTPTDKPTANTVNLTMRNCIVTPVTVSRISFTCTLRDGLVDSLSLYSCSVLGDFVGRNGDYRMKKTDFTVPPALGSVPVFTLELFPRVAALDQPRLRFIGGALDRSTTSGNFTTRFLSATAFFKSTEITTNLYSDVVGANPPSNLSFSNCTFLPMLSGTAIIRIEAGFVSLMGSYYNPSWLFASTGVNSRVDRDTVVLGPSALVRNATTAVTFFPAFSDNNYTVEYVGDRSGPGTSATGNVVPYTTNKQAGSFSYRLDSGTANELFQIILRRTYSPYVAIPPII